MNFHASSIISFLKKHYLAIIFSFVVGLIVVAPNITFINSKDYRGIPMIYTDYEDGYLSRINANTRGCVWNCNPHIKYSNKFPFADSSISEFILAIPSIVTGLSILKIKVVYEFILPFMLTLLLYSLIYRLTRNILLSILGSVIVMLGYNLYNVSSFINLYDILKLFSLDTEHTQFLLFSRPVNPQFSSIIFITYLHSLLSLIRYKNIKWLVIHTFNYGLSFYIYFFTYVFLTVVQLLLIITALLFHKIDYFKLFSLTTVIGWSIAIYQFIEIFNLLSHPFYSTLPTRFLVHSHLFHFSLLGLVLFISFIVVSILYILRRRADTDLYFVVVVVFACFIMRNQHVITGMIMQYDHFENYLFTPILVIATCYYLNIFFTDKNSLIINRILFLVIMITVINAITIQYYSYQRYLPQAISDQKFVGILDWINGNIKEGSVISAYDTYSLLSRYIPMYTHNYVLSNQYALIWMHVPDNIEEAEKPRLNRDEFITVGKKNKVDYYIEQKDTDIIYGSKGFSQIFEDSNFRVYKPK